MDLSGRKSHMKDGSDDLEGDLPPRPKAPEEVHGDDRFARGSRRRCDAGQEKDSFEEDMSVRENAVENDCDVREELGNDIKSA